MLQQIGAYEIQSLLGSGGMGSVYLAWDGRLNRHVAVKRLHRRHGELSAEHQRRFRSEARAAASLSHPSVVQVFDFVEMEDGDWIVMEYVDGEPITRFLMGGALDLGLALRLGYEIADGLAFAHRQGWVHRDLKAENVMVNAAGHAKILDFGLVLAADDPETVRERVGTPYAMAPEQIVGGAVDARADLFAFGVLLYQMTTGRRPFGAEGRDETLQQVLKHEPPPPIELNGAMSPRLDALILRLLGKDPKHRPSDAAQVALALREMERQLADASSNLDAVALSGDVATFEEASTWLPESSYRSGASRWILVLCLCLLAISLRPGGSAEGGPPEPLRIAILQPEVIAEGEAEVALNLVGSAVLTAALTGLTHVPGVDPVDPRQVPDPAAPPTAIALATGADEVLWSAVESWPGVGARVTLRRVDGATGAVRWTRSFEAPIGIRDLRLIADSVMAYLFQAFPNRVLGSPPPGIEVHAADYAEYLSVLGEFKASGLANRQQVESLRILLENSPRFVAGYLLASDLALSVVSNVRDPQLMDDIEVWVRRAEELAPDDPRPLYRRFRARTQSGDLDAAATILRQLELLAPGDPEILFSSALLAERRNDLDGARQFLLRAAEGLPSWGAFWRLARVEMLTGRIEDARRHLEMVLELAPGHPRGLSKLAELELLYGSLDRAQQLYLEQIEVRPRRHLYTNLGLVYFLQRRFDDAIVHYGQALQFDPEHPMVQLNLADAEMASGAVSGALERYERVLQRLRELDADQSLAADERMLMAQCLARLGSAEQAADLVETTVSAHAENGEVMFQAAVVYAVIGHREAALEAMGQALELGVQPRWFTIPALDALRQEVTDILQVSATDARSATG